MGERHITGIHKKIYKPPEKNKVHKCVIIKNYEQNMSQFWVLYEVEMFCKESISNVMSTLYDLNQT